MRVERQAVGRTARKGNPGTSILILNCEHLPVNSTTMNSFRAREIRNLMNGNRMKSLSQHIEAQSEREGFYNRFIDWVQQKEKELGKKVLTNKVREQLFYRWGIAHKQMIIEKKDLQSIFNHFMDDVRGTV